MLFHTHKATQSTDVYKNGKGSPYSIIELIPVLGSQPAGDVSQKSGGRLPLLSARPAVTVATMNGPITIAIRARFEYDSSTIRLQSVTTRYEVFLCARIRDRFEHSTRISGRRVLHVD